MPSTNLTGTPLRKQRVWLLLGGGSRLTEATRETSEQRRRYNHAVQRQRRALEPKPTAPSTPNLDRAVELLQNLPTLWEHPGVTQDQRRELIREVFEEIRLRNGKLVAIKPRAEYIPLFAYSIWKQDLYVGDERLS